MTEPKPTDSKQHAERPVSEAARGIAKDLRTEFRHPYPSLEAAERMLQAFADQAAAEAVKGETLRCAKIVCAFCRLGTPRSRDAYLAAPDARGHVPHYPCAAEDIGMLCSNPIGEAIGGPHEA